MALLLLSLNAAWTVWWIASEQTSQVVRWHRPRLGFYSFVASECSKLVDHLNFHGNTRDKTGGTPDRERIEWTPNL